MGYVALEYLSFDCISGSLNWSLSAATIICFIEE